MHNGIDRKAHGQWVWHYRGRLISWTKQFKYSVEPRKHGTKPDGKSKTTITKA